MSALMVMAIGLASRKYPGLFPQILGKYPGDALWALLVFLILGIVKPSWPTLTLAVIALGISYLDEISQLCQAPWLNSARGTSLGHIILGSSFSWRDLLAYTVGIALAIVIDKGLSVAMRSNNLIRGDRL